MAMTGGKAYCVVDETSTSGNRVRLYIYVKEKSQSTSTNSTILQLGMYVNSTYDIGAWYKSSDSYIGTATSGSNCYTFDGSISKGSGTRWLIENKEVTVKHNTDGTKSVNIYWKWGVNAYTSYISGYQNPSGSKTVALTTIPQASTITSANNITLNGADQICTINVSRKSSKFYHKVKITCGSKSVTTEEAFTTSVGVKIPNSWLSQFPSATYKNATVKLTTYTSSACTTQVGSSDSTTIKIKAGSSIKPSATSLTASIVNGIKNGTKTYCIKGKSSVKLTVNGAKAGTGASIDSYIFTGPNISRSSSTYTGDSSTKTSSVIQSTGNLSYSVQVKDTRERLSSKVSIATPIKVIDYTLPIITSFKVERNDGDDEKATAIIKITYKNITVDGTANTPTVTLQKGSNAAVPLGSTELDSTSTNTTTNVVTNTYKYTYAVTITDTSTITAKLYDTICGSKNATTKSVKLQSASRTLNIAKYGNGIAIGGMSTVKSSTADSKFECNWKSYFKQNLYLNDASGAQQSIRFCDGGKSKWETSLYKGDSTSTTVIGMYDVTNSRSVWRYLNDGIFNFYRPVCIANDYSYQSYKNDKTTKFNLIKLNQHNNIVIGDINDKNTDGTASKTFIGGVYNHTTAKSANTYIGSGHQLWRISSSSQRYKTDILPIQSDALSPDKLYDLPVREFKYREGYLSDEDRLVDVSLPGFIAEEVDEFYPIACEYDESDRPENWNIRIMVPPMLKLIQEQHEEIELLKLRVEQQQKEIEALRTEVDNMKNK